MEANTLRRQTSNDGGITSHDEALSHDERMRRWLYNTPPINYSTTSVSREQFSDAWAIWADSVHRDTANLTYDERVSAFCTAKRFAIDNPESIASLLGKADPYELSPNEVRSIFGEPEQLVEISEEDALAIRKRAVDLLPWIDKKLMWWGIKDLPNLEEATAIIEEDTRSIVAEVGYPFREVTVSFDPYDHPVEELVEEPKELDTQDFVEGEEVSISTPETQQDAAVVKSNVIEKKQTLYFGV